MFETVSFWKLQQHSQNNPELYQQSDASGIYHSRVYSRHLRQSASHSGHEPSEQKGIHEDSHPIVENMVNEMCEREKKRMKALNPKDLGSWSQAVTSADGTWLTQRHHSKNATFSISVGHCCTISTFVRREETTSSRRSCTRGHPSQQKGMAQWNCSKSERRGPANCRTLAGCRLHCK